ncbi:MAG TPA: Flp family type IVb pilin [Thermoanaerobaculia bacterium]|nr:Flp family type IVb pilin [Thermoanaerobaculia bacterium]
MDKTLVGQFLRDESGQAMTEYILIIALVALPIWALFRIAIVAFLNVFISNMLSSFTRG